MAQFSNILDANAIVPEEVGKQTDAEVQDEEDEAGVQDE